MRTVSVLSACLISVALFGASLASCGNPSRPRDLMTSNVDMTQIFPGCPNTIIDEGETDVDCGGPTCGTKCGEGLKCKVKTDCTTDICVMGTCAAANICSDGMMNGDESDKDCGGSCTPCKFDQACTKSTDCLSGTCVGNKCGRLKASLTAGKARSMGVNPVNVATADFDGDGKLDLVSLSGSDEVAMVALGKGDGTFNNPIQLMNIPPAESPETLAAGDIDGDGKGDIVYTNAGQVIVLLADTPMMQGQVLFKRPVPTLIGSDPGSPLLVDVDKDGKLDLVSVDTSYDANANGYNVWVSLNMGSGKWKVGKRIFNPNDCPSSPVVGDFNGDDKLDVAVLFGGKVNVSLQKPDGNFGPWVPTATGMLSATQIIGADFNNTFDFLLDMVVLDRNGGAYGLMTGAGDGILSRPSRVMVMNGPSHMALVDFDLDSLPDFATANYDNDSAGVYLGTGEATFMPGPVAAANTSPTYIIAADVNKDGKPDLITANPSIDVVTVLLNKSM